MIAFGLIASVFVYIGRIVIYMDQVYYVQIHMGMGKCFTTEPRVSNAFPYYGIFCVLNFVYHIINGRGEHLFGYTIFQAWIFKSYELRNALKCLGIGFI